MSASEKISALEKKLKDGLIDVETFTKKATEALAVEIADYSLKEGDVYRATNLSDGTDVFIARKVNGYGSIRLWRMSAEPSYATMRYWEEARGYKGWTQVFNTETGQTY